MPELPEVEVVRRGLVSWVLGRSIDDVEIIDERSIRRHALGAEDLRGNLIGTVITDVVRRGKFLWMPLREIAAGDRAARAAAPRVALMAHLGMSGQLLVEDQNAPDEKHLKVRFSLSPVVTGGDGGRGVPTKRSELRFVDQRIFGGVFLTELIATSDGEAGGLSETPLPLIPSDAAHIARDPLDPTFSMDHFFQRLRRRKTGIKRALLDQSLISGVGNIYADEALWAAKLHFARPTDTMRRADAVRLIDGCRAVMLQALEAGGTSFDALYVNVNGASGYFDRSLNAYGREGEPCKRCAAVGLGTKIRRDSFMNRSSYSCPVCQRRPRTGRW